MAAPNNPHTGGNNMTAVMMALLANINAPLHWHHHGNGPPHPLRALRLHLLSQTPFGRLPSELLDQIIRIAERESVSNSTRMSTATATLLPIDSHPALTPPRNGSSPFMLIPVEMRRAIFACELTTKDKNVPYLPQCDTEAHKPTGPVDEKMEATKRNRASTLMTLNSTIADEIATMLYEERYFVIHVHEGFGTGGVEFLNAGRQKLQYQDEFREDARFARFKHGEKYGFDRLKKLKIVIHPASSDEPDNRHIHMNTFFMIWALCQLLQNSDEEKNKLTHISVEFAPAPVRATSKDFTGRRAIARADPQNYLWDVMADNPSTTSVRNCPDIEVILRPFSILRTHKVEITLPEKLDGHVPTVEFVARLQRRMRSSQGNADIYDHDFMNEEYAHRIRGLSGDFGRYTFELLYSTGKGTRVDGLNSGDMAEDGEDGENNEDDEEDGKRDLSPMSKRSPASDSKRWKGEGGSKRRDEDLDTFMSEEDRDMEIAMERSLQDMMRAPPPSLRHGTHQTGSSTLRAGPSSLSSSAGNLFASTGRTLGGPSTNSSYLSNTRARETTPERNYHTGRTLADSPGSDVPSWSPGHNASPTSARPRSFQDTLTNASASAIADWQSLADYPLLGSSTATTQTNVALRGRTLGQSENGRTLGEASATLEQTDVERANLNLLRARIDRLRRVDRGGV
ncbi:hypothetical protein LTR56_022081 [Elasticomyces elasticus]|nr:hypothetical protein LTR56_022081 [Elasticomyces elasticus]KAK3629589.1 hypothetical protein LTR22_021866 [Elasticomyces elasticus]KAK4919715.1 hypothetical protein LTR49_012618 [Elasticomyces elasticus]KAK5758464.1 hypothetical protein LTS12_011486 [Elasticomyces elasticus]